MTDASQSALKASFIACFVMLVGLVVVYGLTQVVFVGVGGNDRVGGWLSVLLFASLFVYFRFPWIAALTTWAELVREFYSAMPWERHSVGFYWWGIPLVVVANTGAMCHLLLQRKGYSRDS